MPPYGLYPILSPHLYGSGQQARRRTFSSLDFKDEAPVPVEKVIKEAVEVVNDIAGEQHKDKSKKDEKAKSQAPSSAERFIEEMAQVAKDKKKKKRHSMGEERADKASRTPVSASTAATLKAHSSKGKSKRREKDTEEPRSSIKKKRKRDSEVNFDSPSLGRDGKNSDSFLGPEFLKNLETSVGDIGAKFSESAEPEESNKIANVKQRKSNAVQDAQTGAVRPMKKSIETEATPAKKQKSKEKSRGGLDTDAATTISKVQKTAMPYATTPKETPIPLPQQSSVRPANVAASTPKCHALPERSESEVLVAETPPSRMSSGGAPAWKIHVPFGLSSPTGAATERKKTTTVSGKFITSSATKPPSSAPTALFRTKVDAIEPSGQDSLTSSNLIRYTAPLNDDPKPRPRGRESSVSSASSMSIKEAFARIGKPSLTLATELYPFFTPTSKKKDTHVEASAHTFNKTFLLAQATVNFTGEQEARDDHMSIRATNNTAGPLPCLKQASGCSAKSEQILRFMKDENSTLLKLTVCTDAEQAAFDTAVASALEAERFLSNAMAARVPVPLGNLEGVYTLYCPKYSATHVDKYGVGQRTLSISRPLGFKSSSNLAARLSIPPSPVPCTLLAFAPPPHASFRVTMLTTSAEGYSMGLVCLGNGYILLRVDIGLLLTGKKSEFGRDVCMEFVGVREKDVKTEEAVRWPLVEEEEKKRTAVEQAKKTEETPRKKRGRPSNADLERRAKEKEGLTHDEA